MTCQDFWRDPFQSLWSRHNFWSHASQNNTELLTHLSNSTERSLSEDLRACLPEPADRQMLRSTFSRIVLALSSALQIRDTAFSVTFGPRCFFACLTKLLLCSTSRSKAMFFEGLPLLFTVLFHIKRSASLGLNSAFTRKDWYKHSSAYFVLCFPSTLQ